MKWKKMSLWAMQIISAAILLQTLRYKFTGHAESVEIFSMLGMEPFGRIGVGIAELIAGIFLLIPRVAVYGAILGVILMLGAVIAHIFVLGFTVLFFMAIIVLFCCIGVVWLRKEKINEVL